MEEEGSDEWARSMRVMVLLEAYVITGSAKGVLEFARETVRRPAGGPVIDLSLVTFRRGDAREQPVLGDAIRELGVPWEAVEERGRFDPSVIEQLRVLAEKCKPDVVWSNSVKSHFLVRWGGLHQGRGWMAFHHGYTWTDTKMRVYNQLDRWSLRRANRIMTVCRPFAGQLRGMGVAEDRIQIQHMPIRDTGPSGEEDRAEARRLLRAQPADRLILTVGRLSKEKGQAVLLEAFARLLREQPTGLHLVVVGDGPERPVLRQLCQKLRICEHVTFAGQQSNVRRFYDIADLFVLPSHSEGSPNALLEAMSAKTPVVATRVGGIPEMATNGNDALLVDPADPRAMAEAMVRILGDDSLRQRLIASGRSVLSRHTVEGYFRAVAAVLAEVSREASKLAGASA